MLAQAQQFEGEVVMRVKTNERRQSIIDASREIFQEIGYERTSMAMISNKVGGSKATLYSYFKSKEELFAAVMLESVEAQCDALLGILDDGSADVAESLQRFGEAYVDIITSPECLAVTRCTIVENGNPELYKALFDNGPRRAEIAISAYLARFMEQKVLRAADPDLAALHLKGLLEAGIKDPLLCGAQPAVVDFRQAVAAAVDTFLRAYRA